MGEEDLSGLDTKDLVGHLAAWNDFMSADTLENKAFIDQWHMFIKNDKRTVNDPMEATHIGFNMWVNAVTAAAPAGDIEKPARTTIGPVIDALAASGDPMAPNCWRPGATRPSASAKPTGPSNSCPLTPQAMPCPT